MKNTMVGGWKEHRRVFFLNQTMTGQLRRYPVLFSGMKIAREGCPTPFLLISLLKEQ